MHPSYAERKHPTALYERHSLTDGKGIHTTVGGGEDRLASHLVLPWFVDTSQKGSEQLYNGTKLVKCKRLKTRTSRLTKFGGLL